MGTSESFKPYQRTISTFNTAGSIIDRNEITDFKTGIPEQFLLSYQSTISKVWGYIDRNSKKL
jgi:hypothetical protein